MTGMTTRPVHNSRPFNAVGLQYSEHSGRFRTQYRQKRSESRICHLIRALGSEMDQSLAKFHNRPTENLSKKPILLVDRSQTTAVELSCLTSMLPTGVPLPFSCDKDNIAVTRGEKRTRRNVLIDGQSPSRSTATLQAFRLG
jgi:hypothetical protein